MATTSIWRVKGWFGKVVIYAENPEKTANPKFYADRELTEQDGQQLSDVIRYAVNSEKTQETGSEDGAPLHRFVSGINCSPATARDEILAVKKRFGKEDGTVAYMSLMENEMRRFQFQQGDSEGFVNYALTIKKVKMSAMFLAHRKFIRISLRSRGDVDVNLFARRYFNGGGHKNAAGGKSFLTMQETIDHYVRSVREFAEEGRLG